jgi:hypothetical protein
MKFSEFLKKANWPMVVYLSLVHIAGTLGMLYFTSSMKQTLVWFAFAYFWGGVGITVVHIVCGHTEAIQLIG